jgi:hypothetical protein
VKIEDFSTVDPYKIETVVEEEEEEEEEEDMEMLT